MSLLGTWQTFGPHPQMSAFGGKADSLFASAKCLHLTQSGHRYFCMCLFGMLGLSRYDALPSSGAAMKRRQFIRLLGGVFAWPVVTQAQQRVHLRRLGVLMPFRESDAEAQRRLTAFSDTLRQIGWVEGQSFVFEKRFSDGKPERLPALAAELVNANVDVIVTQSSEFVQALRVATTSIPIVMASVGDALGAGYVASLARPGGNITGLTLVATEQSAKRLQLIKQLSPAIIRVAVLLNANTSGHGLQLKEMEPAAKTLDLALQPLAVRTASDIDSALHAATQAKAQAIITMDDPMILSQRVRITEFGLQQFMPVIGDFGRRHTPAR